MTDNYVTEGEVYELLGLMHQKSILRNLVSMDWSNYFDIDDDHLMQPGLAADQEHFQLLLDTLQVSFPHIGPFI
jgi:hypothetical protein